MERLPVVNFFSFPRHAIAFFCSAALTFCSGLALPNFEIENHFVDRKTVAATTIDQETGLLDDFLAKSNWANSLTAEQFQRTRSSIFVRELQTGNYVCRKGDPSEEWIGVMDGLVRIENLSQAGKLVNFGTFPAHSWFGEGAVLKKEMRKYDAIAMRASRVVLMPAATFFWLLDVSIPFNRFVITQLNDRLGQYLGAFEHDRLEHRKSRVALAIADISNPRLYQRQEGRIEISNEELGNLVGISRQSINQILHELEKTGLIKRAYRVITVLDIEGLRDFGRQMDEHDI